MHLFKMTLGAALVAGSLSGCVISTGGTDTNVTSLGSDSNATTDTAGTTDTTAGTTDTTDGTATDTAGTTDTTDDTATTVAPTTTAPTSTTEATTETAGTTDTTTGGGMCGWSTEDNYYSCGFEGEDPDGVHPLGCPEGLVDGEPCSNTGLTPEGCCDAEGNNWYCGDDMGMQIAVLASCS